MNVVYCFNDNYDYNDKEQISYLFISLISLLKNNPKINIYIIYLNFNQDNFALFKDYFKKNSHQIHLIKFPNKYENNLNEMMSLSCKTNAGTFLRLFIGELLPKNIEHVLYIDTDTIINKSLNEFFKLKEDNIKIVAIREFKEFQKEKEAKFNLKKNSYFNAGVLLLNLKLIRNELSSYALETFRKFGDENFYADQDVLNIMYNDSLKLVSLKFNYMVQRKFSKDIVIYHYAGNGRIIKNKHCLIENEYKKLFWKYFDMTPWKNWRPKSTLIQIIYLIIYKLIPKKIIKIVQKIIKI